MSDSLATIRINTREFLGIPFRQASPMVAAKWMVQTATEGAPDRRNDIHLVNAYSLALSRRNQDLREIYSAARANFADGRPLVWFTRGTGQTLSQVRGPELFENVMNIGREAGLRHFLLGGSPETLALLMSALRERYPGVNIVGAESPPFRALTHDELSAQDERILRSEAQIVWVGLGTPKQDFEAARLGRNLSLPTVAVGAAFDFSAGTKSEAPQWIRSVGLEWLFRLLSEPRRLWRRYLVGNTVFLAAAIPHWLKGVGENLFAREADGHGGPA